MPSTNGAARRGIAGPPASRRTRRWATGTRTTSPRTPTSCAPSGSRRRRASTPIEAAAAVAGESSTATWTVVWTDRLTVLRALPGQGLPASRRFPGTPGQYIAYIAYDIDLFEEGSIANLTSSIIGNVFGFKALKALRLEDMRIPSHYVKTFHGSAARDRHGARVPRQVRPPAASARRRSRSSACRPRTTAASSTRRCAAGWTSPRTTRTSTRSRSCAGATATSTPWRPCSAHRPRTGEVKGHYMNVTAATMEDMYERAEFAKEIGSIIIMMDLTVGYTAMTSMSKWCRAQRHDPAPAPRRPRHLHAPEDATACRSACIAKWCRLLGVDHIHAGTVVGKLEGDPAMITGYYDDPAATRYNHAEPRRQGIYFDQDWASLPGVMPVASGGIHAGQMHQLLHYLGEDVVLQFGGGTIGHPMGIAAGADAPTASPSRR